MASASLTRAVAGMALLLSAAPASAAAARAGTEPPSPQKMTFGAPLTEPPDAQFDCGTLPLPDGSTAPLPGAGSSCVWSTPLNPADPIQGLTTPVGTGTITGVRIRVGASTGPMSLVVLEAERNVATQAVSCCEATVVTQPFMPAVNEINAFRTDLPVHTDAPGGQGAGGVQVTDMLALAVLNGATPIPAVYVGDAGEAPADELTSPAPLQGQTASILQTSGYQLDMQADWVSGTPAPATPRLRFASGRVFVSRGYLHVPLSCRRAACGGAIVVKSTTGATPSLTYASGSFRIGHNLYRSIAVPLSPAGQAAARAGQRRRVTIEVRYRTPSSARRISRMAVVRF